MKQSCPTSSTGDIQPNKPALSPPASPQQERSALDLAEICFRQQNIVAAQMWYQKALEDALKEGRQSEAAQAWSGMGAVYQQQGKLDAALQCFQEALHTSINCDDALLQVPYWNDLGTAYFMAGNYLHALKSHHSAWQFSSEEDIEGCIFSLSGMAAAYYKLGEHENSVQTYLQALGLIDRSPNEQAYSYSGSVCMGLGKSYYQLGQIDASVDYFERALAMAECSNERTMLVESYLSLGSCYFSQQKPGKAWDYYHRASGLIKEGASIGSLYRAYTGLGMCYLAAADTQNALLVLKKALEGSKIPGKEDAPPPLHGDEQLLGLLHTCIKQYQLQPDRHPEMFVFLWGLVAVVLSLVDTSTPTSMPPGLVDTTIQTLMNIDRKEVEGARTSSFVQHYCMYVLQQLSTQPRHMELVLTSETIDAILTCMLSPPDELLGLTRKVTRVLKSFLINRPPGFPGPDVCELILHSTKLPILLDVLPQQRKVQDPDHLKPVLYVLSVFSTISEFQRNAQGECHSPVRRSCHNEIVEMVVKSVSTLTRAYLAVDSHSEMDTKVLRFCLKILVDFARNSEAARNVAYQTLDVQRLDACLAGPVAGPSSSLHTSALELRKIMADGCESPTFPRTPSNMAKAFNESLNTDESNTNTTTLDSQEQDTTTFESLSSHSSFSISSLGQPRKGACTIAIRHLSLGFGDFDDELSLSSDAI